MTEDTIASTLLSPALRTLINLGYITEEWARFAPEAFEYFYKVIGKALVNKAFYPEDKSIFRAFNECSPENLKVVIIGQDPYFDGSAVGLSFENVRTQRKLSPSLKNILTEMMNDVGSCNFTRVSEDQTILGNLPTQGVLLINTALTVEPGKAGSHTHIWQGFTKLMFEALSKKNNLIYIMWGNHAKSFKQNISNETAHFIEGGHPSPLNTSLTSPFKGGKYFSKCNTILTSLAQTSIQW